ncbi:hypothetical protein [Galenea microaerophila]
MGDLNNDWVLYGSILALVLTVAALLGFAWKAIKGIEGLEKDENKK